MGGANIASRRQPDVKSALARYTPLSVRTGAVALSRAFRSIYALPEIQALLQAELGLLPGYVARQPRGRALLLHPDAQSRRLPADLAHLEATRLHVADGDSLRGDVICSPRALPMEDDAFQLVFAQHVGDAQNGAAGLVGEIARVMAPGALLLWCGFNPWSPWLAWVHWHLRGGGVLPQTLHADALRRRLQRAQLAPQSLEYLGSVWPRRGTEQAAIVAAGTPWLAPLRGAYLVAARKQRAVLTPLRPRVRRPVALGARLAGTSSQRACA